MKIEQLTIKEALALKEHVDVLVGVRSQINHGNNIIAERMRLISEILSRYGVPSHMITAGQWEMDREGRLQWEEPSPPPLPPPIESDEK